MARLRAHTYTKYITQSNKCSKGIGLINKSRAQINTIVNLI